MKPSPALLTVAGLLLLLAGVAAFRVSRQGNKQEFVSYIVDPRCQHLRLYWKDESSQPFGSIQNLKQWLARRRQKLVFAMNGGMYQQGNVPLGLFVANQTTFTPLNTRSGRGNFYLQPNGVFYLTADRKPVVCPTAEFPDSAKVSYATQSGPMLLINGRIHPAFRAGSKNLNIRNGVGILPGNRVLFAMSKKEISLYDFARFFQSQGCRNALYLDGLVSRTYLPEKAWVQTDGDFGVIIGVTVAN